MKERTGLGRYEVGWQSITGRSIECNGAENPSSHQDENGWEESGILFPSVFVPSG